MKTRLLGAAVLLALLVLFVPMFFSSKPPAPGGDQTVSLAIPPAPDRDLQTKTMSLTPDAPVGTPPTAAANPSAGSPAGARPSAVTPGTSGGLATVDINSNRPRDVQGSAAPVPNTVSTGSGASAAQPVIPMQNKPTAAIPATRQPAVVTMPSKTPKAAVADAGAAASATNSAAGSAHGSYMLNLSAYASAAGAASLQQRVHALGYPVNSHLTTQAGKSRTLVIAGPFDTRTAAEAARLKITQSIPGVPAHLQQDAGPQAASGSAAASAPTVARPTASSAPAAAVAPVKGRAGGFAVQLAAMSSQRDATALRDKLRSNGFDGFVDSVQSGGKQLWRVRAGPQTQRADAQRLHDQIKAKLGIDGNIVSVP